ncbi:MAG: hypothetical protein JW712_13910 [Dehalococcoidales bacterium]|nr:hypothetical protein [Dehalococcoidales bacterium]
MNAYKEISLNIHKSTQYLTNCLLCGHTLSNSILNFFNLDDGHISTSIPINGDETNVYDFTHGRIFPEIQESEWQKLKDKDNSNAVWVPVQRVLKPVVDTIHRYLSDNPSGVCIVDETLAKSTDKWLQRIETKILVYNDEVYHYVDYSRRTIKEIEEMISNSPGFWPPFIGVLTTIPAEMKKLIIGKEIHQDILNVAAKQTKKIIVSAYDGEGYLIWNKIVDSG